MVKGTLTKTLSSVAVAATAVGASQNLWSNSMNMTYVAFFSSIGPTADNRIKPDVVAPGYPIRSANALSTCKVVEKTGEHRI
jgi:serine protease AprX